MPAASTTKPNGQQIKIASMPLSGQKAEGHTRTGGGGPGPDVQDLVARQAQPRGQTAGHGQRHGAGKINLEAYEAYHNSKDNALLLSQTKSEEMGKE